MLGGCGRASPRPKRNRSCARWSLRSARAEPAATRVLRQCMCNRGCCEIRSVRRWEDTEDIIARRATGRGGERGRRSGCPSPGGWRCQGNLPAQPKPSGHGQAHVRAVRGTSDLDPWRVAGSMKGAERDRRARLSQNLLSQNGYATLICFFLRTVGYFIKSASTLMGFSSHGASPSHHGVQY